MNLTASDVFISSTIEDKAFATKLNLQLRESGISTWNESAPAANKTREFKKAVTLGIQHSDNFIYILSPTALLSEACLVELLQAKKSRKPIITVVAQKPTVEDENRFIHPALADSVWINFDRAVFGDKYAELIAELRNDADFKRHHSIYLHKANIWLNDDRKKSHLLSGRERTIAQQWLDSQADDHKEYGITLTEAEYICESKKHIEGAFSDVFFGYTPADAAQVLAIREIVTLAGFTSWNNRKEIATLSKHSYTETELIELTNCFLFFLSANSLKSEACMHELKYAFELNKKIITIKLDEIAISHCPNFLKNFTIVDLTRINESSDEPTIVYAKKLLIRNLQEHHDLHSMQSELFARAKAWRDLEYDRKILLTGYQLVYAEKWLQNTAAIGSMKTLPVIDEFIESSSIASDNGFFDAYLSYANEDFLYAKRISFELHNNGKRIWFDPKELKNASENDEAVKDTIVRSHCVLILVSPGIFDSPSVKKELRWAKNMHKKIIPVLIAPVQEDILPIEFQRGLRVNGIFQNDSIQHTISKILRALENLDQLTRDHSRWLAPALLWDERGRKHTELLSTSQAIEAHNWLNQTLNQFDSPHPVVQQLEFIRQSKKEADSKHVVRNRSLWASGALILIFIFSLLWISNKRHNAEDHYKEVGTHLLAYQAKSIASTDPTLSLRLAESAYKFNPNDPNTYRSILSSYFLGLPLYDKLYESPKSIYAVALSPDNRRILIATEEKRAILFDLDGNELTSFQHKDIVWSAKFSPDGKYVATASQDNEFKIWTLDGNLLRHINYEAEVFDISFSPDGELIVVAGGDKTVRIYNFKGEEISRFKAGGGAIELAEFSPSGNSIVTLSALNEVTIWTKKGERIKTVPFKAQIRNIHFSGNDTTLIVAGSTYTTGVWSTNGNKLLHLPVGSAAYFIANDGKAGFITTSEDNVARLWNAKGELINEFRGHTSKINALCSSSDGTMLFTVSGDITENDRSLRMWHTHAIPSNWEIQRENNSMKIADYSPDGRYFAVAMQETVEIFDAVGKAIAQFRTAAEITDLAFSRDGKSIFTAHDDEWIRQYSWEGKKLQQIKSGHSAVTCLALSPTEDVLVYTGYEPVITIYNLVTKETNQFVGHDDAINSLEFSNSGLFVSSSEDGTAKVWNTNAKLKETLTNHKAGIIDAHFSSDSKSIITASMDTTVSVWSVDGDSLTSLPKQSSLINSAVFLADNLHVLTASLEGHSRLWTIDGTLVYTFKSTAEFEKQNKVLCSPDSEYVLLLNDDELNAIGKAKIYRINPTEIVKKFNDKNVSGNIWQLDAATKAQLHVLE